MKRFAILIPLITALALSACGESSLPVATGKASMRSINGVQTSPEVAFLIEERTIGIASYRQATAQTRFDDLAYNFNFDVRYAGEIGLVRVASVFVDIIKDLDYIFVLTGTLADPSILTWETVVREFTGTETVFEARFTHTSDSLGSVDYFFAAPGVDPVAGEEAGTLVFGEVLPSIDFEAGEYVLTITSSGMPDQVLFESRTTTFSAAAPYIITSFDGGGNTFAPIIGQAYASGAGSGSIAMPDVNYPPTLDIVNGSLAIDTVDIYEDELLTSQIVADHAYQDVTDELEFSIGDNSFLYTPTTLLSPVLIDDVVALFSGIRGRFVAYGPLDALQILSYVPDRQSVETHAKLHLFNAAINYAFLNVYVVDADTTIEGEFPARPLFQTGAAGEAIALDKGSYDIYFTSFDSLEILAGPTRIDVQLGDVLGGIVFDTVDPAVLEFNFLPNNP